MDSSGKIIYMVNDGVIRGIRRSGWTLVVDLTRVQVRGLSILKIYVKIYLDFVRY